MNTATDALARLAKTAAVSMRESHVLRLTREVRLALRPFVSAEWFYDLCVRVTVSGTVDRATGYLCDAGQLETWVLACAGLSPELTLADFSPADQLAAMWARLAPATPAGLKLEELELSLSPTWRWSVCPGNDTVSPPWRLLTRQFHFCAAHRLHHPNWSEEENRRVFGACSNLAGHGHNYLLEVTVTVAERAKPELVERVVQEQVLDRFDHRHFNVDVPELAGLNPTVETLTDIIWNALDAALPPRMLWSVRLHETPKISAERRQVRERAAD